MALITKSGPFRQLTCRTEGGTQNARPLGVGVGGVLMLVRLCETDVERGTVWRAARGYRKIAWGWGVGDDACQCDCAAALGAVILLTAVS